MFSAFGNLTESQVNPISNRSTVSEPFIMIPHNGENLNIIFWLVTWILLFVKQKIRNDDYEKVQQTIPDAHGTDPT